jgi:hypothetical protein
LPQSFLTSFISLIAAVVLLTAANWFYTRRATAAAKAARQSSFTQATCRSYVPQQWGEYKGSSSGFDVAFEDSSGPLRFVTNVACECVPPIALMIQRGTPK